VVLQLARLVLAGVFVVSAVAKLADRGGVRRAIVAFGAPERAAGAIGWLAICAELVVAVALFSGRGRAAGAIGALALVGVFSAVLATALARGRTAECRCFGRLSARELGWRSLTRNLLLAALAGYVAVDAALPGFAAIAVVAAGLWLGPSWLRSGVGGGGPAPAFLRLDELLRARRPVLLVFSQAGCGACTMLLPDLAGWYAELRDQLTLALVGPSPPSGTAGYPVEVWA
jgi:hypothetical protein